MVVPLQYLPGEKCGFQYLEYLIGLETIHCPQKFGFSLIFFQSIQGECGVTIEWFICQMSYLYGRRFVGPLTGIVMSLREELYTALYGKIDWNQARNMCAKEDLYYPHPFLQDILWATLHIVVEPALMHWPGSMLRERAFQSVMKHVHYEDENTRYICIGPVNKVLNMLCCWVEDSNSEAFKRHLPRIADYLWVAEDGMKMQGYNGSQLWDTAFAS